MKKKLLFSLFGLMVFVFGAKAFGSDIVMSVDNADDVANAFKDIVDHHMAGEVVKKDFENVKELFKTLDAASAEKAGKGTGAVNVRKAFTNQLTGDYASTTYGGGKISTILPLLTEGGLLYDAAKAACETVDAFAEWFADGYKTNYLNDATAVKLDDKTVIESHLATWSGYETYKKDDIAAEIKVRLGETSFAAADVSYYINLWKAQIETLEDAKEGSDWTDAYGSYLNTTAEDLKAIMDADLYGKIKTGIVEFGELSDGQKQDVTSTDSVAAAQKVIDLLDYKNFKVANEIVQALVNEINGNFPSLDKYKASEIEDMFKEIQSLKDEFNAWGAYKADFSFGSVGYAGLSEKLDNKHAELKAKNDYVVAFEELKKYSFEYTLIEPDLTWNPADGASVPPTNYQILWNLNKAIADMGGLETLPAGEREHAAEMLKHYTAMTNAIAILNIPKYHYNNPTMVVNGYNNAGGKTNDLTNMVKAKSALADANVNKYVRQLYTNIDANFNAAKNAFMTFDKGEIEKEAVADFKTKYATVLAEGYVATYADYEAAGVNVKAAINEYKDLSNPTTYWKKGNGNVVSYRYDKCEITAEEITANGLTNAFTEDTKKSSGANIKSALTAIYNNPLQIQAQNAAARMLESYVNGALATVHDGGTYNKLTCEQGYIDPTAETYDALTVLVTVDGDVVNISDAVKVPYTRANKIGYSDIAETGTNFQYTFYDTMLDDYVVYATIDDANLQGWYINNTKGDPMYYQTASWGYNVVKAYKGTNAYWLNLKAAYDAANFVKKYYKFVNPKGKFTAADEADATAALNTYNKMNALTKAYIQDLWDTVMEKNIQSAIGDATGLDSKAKITLYAGNSTPVNLQKIKGFDPTSWKAIEATLAEYRSATDDMDESVNQENSVIVIEAYFDEAILRNNVICYAREDKKADENGNKFKANTITLTDAKNFYFPQGVTVKKVTLTKKFNEYFRPFYVPFEVNEKAMASWTKAGYDVRYLDNVLENYNDAKDKVELTVAWKKKTKTDKLFAMMPYIIKAPAAGSAKLTVNNTTIKATAGDGAVYCNSTSANFELAGNSQAMDIESMKEYMINNKGSFQQLSYVTKDGVVVTNKYGVPVSQSVKLPAGGVRLNVTGIPVVYVIKNDFDVEGEATGIKDINAAAQAGTENIYTIGGQKVSTMSKPGVYVVNGKKVLVK